MSHLIEVKVPDIGDYHDVPVIDVCVKPGDEVRVDSALITMESEKSTFDVPSPAAGIVRELRVKVGDKLSEGAVVAVIEASSGASGSAHAPAPSGAQATAPVPSPTPSPASAPGTAPPVQSAAVLPGLPSGSRTHASPSVRLYARELGVDLNKVQASGPKERILKQDVTAYVKSVMSGGGPRGGFDVIPWPKVDFTKFGPVEMRPLSKIKKISAANLSRNWVMIPSVIYHEDADITDLEAFRVSVNKENEASGRKITMLAFLLKAVEVGLKKFPEFNSSIDGDNLVLKQYYHIAFAADTPGGLVVPVVKNVDQKSVSEIALECSVLAKKAREGKLTPVEMSGACFTISSLGGIGGTSFSPIINAPEVAILGVSKAAMRPVWNGKEFQPRLILPMSLAADHRVIDGALATHFTVHVAQLLADSRRLAV